MHNNGLITFITFVAVAIRWIWPEHFSLKKFIANKFLEIFWCVRSIRNYIFQKCNKIFKTGGLFETVIGVAEFPIRTGYGVWWRCCELLPFVDKWITEILTWQLYWVRWHSFAEILHFFEINQINFSHQITLTLLYDLLCAPHVHRAKREICSQHWISTTAQSSVHLRDRLTMSRTSIQC